MVCGLLVLRRWLSAPRNVLRATCRTAYQGLMNSGEKNLLYATRRGNTKERPDAEMVTFRPEAADDTNAHF